MQKKRFSLMQLTYFFHIHPPARRIALDGFLLLVMSGVLFCQPALSVNDFASVRRDLKLAMIEEARKSLNGPRGEVLIKKSEAFFTQSQSVSHTVKKKSRQVTRTGERLTHLTELAEKISDLLIADALVGETTSTPHWPLSQIDVSQLDILIRDPDFQVLHAKSTQLVQQNLEQLERIFPDAGAKTRFLRVSCSDPSLHGALTEYSIFDSETLTLEFCSRYLPLRGDLTTWEANLSPSATHELRVQPESPLASEMMLAIAPDETIPSTDPELADLKANGSLDLKSTLHPDLLPGLDLGRHPDLHRLTQESGTRTSTGAGEHVNELEEEIHRGPASLEDAQRIRNARLARSRGQLPAKKYKSNTSALSARPQGRSTTQNATTPVASRDVHTTISSSVAAVSAKLTSGTGLRRSQIPATVREGFEFRLQYGRLTTTFWVVSRGTHYDLVYANSSGSRVTLGIPVTSFAYLQDTAEAVHHDVNDISQCPFAKIQMHIVNEGEKEQTIAACVQGKTKAAADLRAMGNLLSTLVR